ncbi:MAG TPA: DUF58 domain-containing protein [Acidobacteriota bacterium]
MQAETKILPREILRKVRRIEIRTRRLVDDVLGGAYHSVFKGRGMEFSEVREYQPGDDIRSIDWNVTARSGAPQVKKFVEERELTVILMVDASSSSEFGSTERMKGEVAAELAALLAFSAIKNNDRVGLLIFTDVVEKFVPPRKGRSHVLRVIRELLYFQPRDRRTDIAAALQYLQGVVRRKAVVFLISDFWSSEYERPLRVAGRRHDLIAVVVSDPRELELPPMGWVEFEDAESGELLLVDTNSRGFRARFEQRAHQAAAARRQLLKRLHLDTVEVCTDRPYDRPLMHFFRQRALRIR